MKKTPTIIIIAKIYNATFLFVFKRLKISKLREEEFTKH